MLIVSFLLCVGNLAAIPPQAENNIQVQLIALYYKPSCPYSKKVLSYLKSHHISIPLKDVSRDPESREELKTIGGYLIVPCLIVNGRPIYEADAIIQWLSENKNPGNLPKS